MRPRGDNERQSPRASGQLRRKFRLAAARIRTSTGVTGRALVQEQRADQPMPWLGLLLWALACVGLFVSLLMQPEDLNRDPRLAARIVAEGPIPIASRAFDLPRKLDNARWLATEFRLPR